MQLKFSQIRVWFGMATLALLAACGGGGGGGSGPASVSLSGTAGKGLLIGADVKAYEVVGGKKSATVWASATTDLVGAYELKGTPTNNPIVVEVSAKTGTKMLDESQPKADGSFTQVDAPNLVLRSFVEKLTQNDTVQVNPLTESAVALAENAKDNTGATLGITLNSLLAAKQFAQQMAPEGVNPFVAALPAKRDDLADERVAKMAVMMAGIITSASNTCDLKCQVQSFSKDVPMTVTADGKGSIDSAKASAISAQKIAVLTAGQTALASKSSELGSMANTVNAVASSALSNTGSISTSTLSASQYSEINSVQGFVKALRESFKTTETKLKSAGESLDKKYQTLTLQGTERLSSAVDLALSQCVKQDTFSCSKPVGSTMNVTWTQDGNGWKGTATSSDGYTFEGTVNGSMSSTSVSFSITNATIKSGTKTLVELVSLTASGVETKQDPNTQKTTAGTLTLTGSIKAYDVTPNSDLYVTLGLTNAQASFDDTAKTFSMKGNLSLASNKNDALTGSLDISGVKQTLTRTYGSYSYTYTDNFIKSAVIKLNASESSAGEILALSINGSRNLQDMSKAPSSVNPETFDVSASVGLANNTTLSLNFAQPDVKTLTQSVTLQSGTSKLRLSGSLEASAFSTSKWCSNQNGVILCTDTLSLSVNDGSYTGVVKKSSDGAVTADLYKGSNSAGTKVGVITQQGMIEIDGQKYSLY